VPDHKATQFVPVRQNLVYVGLGHVHCPAALVPVPNQTHQRTTDRGCQPPVECAEEIFEALEAGSILCGEEIGNVLDPVLVSACRLDQCSCGLAFCRSRWQGFSLLNPALDTS
jgi:hypothetical protein